MRISPVHFLHFYASNMHQICKIMHEHHMQNMQKYVLPSLLMRKKGLGVDGILEGDRQRLGNWKHKSDEGGR